MIAVYVIMSFFLLFVPGWLAIPPSNQKILGLVLVAYSIFRMVRWRKQFLQSKKNEDEH
jgi:hypothetical protein